MPALAANQPTTVLCAHPAGPVIRNRVARKALCNLFPSGPSGENERGAQSRRVRGQRLVRAPTANPYIRPFCATQDLGDPAISSTTTAS